MAQGFDGCLSGGRGVEDRDVRAVDLPFHPAKSAIHAYRHQLREEGNQCSFTLYQEKE